MFVDGFALGAAGATGRGSPFIHHFFTPSISVQAKILLLNGLIVSAPISELGHVRPGAG
ncbi:unannotated protein [freshwater metagenome]|uniref:Unannotated protein n=1 Tax=freshwater metagenome TaxID=449393 RepID=A0A6J5YQ33_9ZZZZ